MFVDDATKEPFRVPVARQNLTERCQVIADGMRDVVMGADEEIQLQDVVSRTTAMLFAARINNNDLPRIEEAHALFTEETPHATRLMYWNVAALAYKYGYSTLIGYYLWAFARILNTSGRGWFTVRVPASMAAKRLKRGRDDDADERNLKKQRFKIPLSLARVEDNAAAVCTVCHNVATGTCAACKQVMTCSPACLAKVHSECFSFHLTDERAAGDTDLDDVVDLLSAGEVDPIALQMMTLLAPGMKNTVQESADPLARVIRAFPAIVFSGETGKSLIAFLLHNTAARPEVVGIIDACLTAMPAALRMAYADLVGELVRVVMNLKKTRAIVDTARPLFHAALLVAPLDTLKKIMARLDVLFDSGAGDQQLEMAASTGRVDVILHLFAPDRTSPVSSKALQISTVDAAMAGHVDAMMTLIEHIPEGNVRYATVDTAFAGAARNGRVDIISALLQSTYLSDQTPYNGALGDAVANGHVQMVHLLLADKRADPTARKFEYIRTAIVHGHDDVVRLLLEDSRVDVMAYGPVFLRMVKESDHPRMEAIIRRVAVERRKKA